MEQTASRNERKTKRTARAVGVAEQPLLVMVITMITMKSEANDVLTLIGTKTTPGLSVYRGRENGGEGKRVP